MLLTMISHYSSLQPCHLFYKHDYDIMNSEKLERHFKLLELVGMLIAHAVFHGEVIDLHLTNPMIKQVCETLWLGSSSLLWLLWNLK